MLTSVRTLLSLGIPLLILICMAILGVFTFASMKQTALDNGMSITRLTADSRQEMFVRYLKRQKLQAKNFIQRSRLTCSRLNIERKNCLQSSLDGFVATINAESARLDAPGLPTMTAGDDKDLIELDPTPDITEFLIGRSGNPYFVIDATDDGTHILTLHVRPDTIHEIFDNPEQLGDFGDTFLVAGDGLFISPANHEKKLKDSNIRKCQAGKSFDVPLASLYGKEFIASFRHVKELNGGCVIAILLVKQALKPVDSLKDEWITLIIIFASLSSAAGYLLTRRITRPIQELSEVALSLQAGNFNIKERKYGGIEEIRLFDETFRKMARSLQTQIQNQEEVLSIVSHDLRNPVAAMKISAQLGQRALTKGTPEEQKEGVEKAFIRIVEQTDQMARLIDDLLDVARAQSGKIEVHLRKVTLGQFLPFIEAMKTLGDEKGIRLNIEFPDNSEVVLADINRINQVFSNLIGNALKFTPTGGQIQVGQKVEADKVLFWVRDSGTGIPEEQLSHIFTKHWQAPGEQKKGVGLGLFITKTIIDGHRGEIWVESKSGAGTSFYFTLNRT